MTIPTTFATLVSAVKERIEDDSSEFEAYIPTAIRIAEERLWKEMDSQNFITYTSVTVSNATYLVTKPNGGDNIPLDLTYTYGTSVKSLLKKNKEYLREYWPVPASTGTPRYYADYDATRVVVAPAFTTIGVATFTTLQKPAVLTASNTTNIFTSLYPNALFFATLSEQCGFSRHYEMKAEVEAHYLEELQTINNMERRKRRDSNSMPVNAAPKNNTLKGDN